MSDDTQGPVNPSEDFEEALKKLPNDLGEEVFRVPIEHDADADEEGEMGEFYALESIPRFDNDDLNEDAPIGKEEMEAMMRLFPEEQLAGGIIAAPGQYVKELAIDKLVRLAKGVVQMEALRQYMEGLGADCDTDLVYAMLSATGEMSRLRTLIPKIGYGMMEAEAEDGEEAA